MGQRTDRIFGAKPVIIGKSAPVLAENHEFDHCVGHCWSLSMASTLSKLLSLGA